MGIQTISIGIFALILSMATPAARTRPPDSVNRLKLIGCVKRSELGAAGATGQQPRYVLVNITLPADANREAASALVAENVKIYRLDESNDQLVASHVGERVELTGILVAPAKRSEADASEPAPPPVLKVETLSTISGASSCNP